MNIVTVTLLRIACIFCLVVAYLLLWMVRACIFLTEGIGKLRHGKKSRHST